MTAQRKYRLVALNQETEIEEVSGGLPIEDLVSGGTAESAASAVAAAASADEAAASASDAADSADAVGDFLPLPGAGTFTAKCIDGVLTWVEDA